MHGLCHLVKYYYKALHLTDATVAIQFQAHKLIKMEF